MLRVPYYKSSTIMIRHVSSNDNDRYGSEGLMEKKDSGITIQIPGDETLVFKVALI
jgi:hypothetical protein